MKYIYVLFILEICNPLFLNCMDYKRDNNQPQSFSGKVTKEEFEAAVYTIQMALAQDQIVYDKQAIVSVISNCIGYNCIHNQLDTGL